jgi:hypothetical protein
MQLLKPVYYNNNAGIGPGQGKSVAFMSELGLLKEKRVGASPGQRATEEGAVNNRLKITLGTATSRFSISDTIHIPVPLLFLSSFESSRPCLGQWNRPAQDETDKPSVMASDPIHPLRIHKSPSSKMAGGTPRPLSEISPTAQRRNSPSWNASATGSPKVSASRGMQLIPPIQCRPCLARACR